MKMIGDYSNYLVFRNGSVLNIKRKFFMKARLGTGGYKVVSLTDDWGTSKTCLVHRLIGIHFISNDQDKPCIDHIDRNRTNNKIDNLRWATYKENNLNKSMMKNNQTGYTGISYDKPRNRYRYKQVRYKSIEEIVMKFDLKLIT